MRGGTLSEIPGGAEEPSRVFCEIVAGRAPASIVYEDDRVLAFMALDQPNPGHVLVIPRVHYAGLLDLPEGLAITSYN